MAIKDFIEIIHQTESKFSNLSFEQNNQIFTCMNCTSYFYARKHPEIFEKMDGIFVDGILMCKALKYVWSINITRRSFDMTSIAKVLFERLNANDCKESVFFIGSKQNQVNSSVENFKKKYPNMKVTGFRNGYFQSETERYEVISKIIRDNPSYVIVGLGKPAQELFALDLKNAGFKGKVFTCGGFLHQSSDNIQYYPKWIDRYNLRWLYRACKEGTWERILNNIFKFPILFLYDRIRSLKIKK